MIVTENLTQVYCALANEKKLEAVIGEINALWETETYKAWWTDKGTAGPFHADGNWKHLTALGLIQDSVLQIRINKIGNRYFMTDVPCLNSRFAVFPYSDEANELLQCVYQEKLHLWADTIIDMSAGCGHTPLGMETGANRYLYDINPRALIYAKINAILNRLPESLVSIACNDIKRDLPPSLLSLNGQKVVFLFNTPFNPAPSSLEAMPISGDGGVTGDDFQIRSFEVVADFKERFQEKQVRALFLSWTFGRSKDGYWAMQGECEKILKAGTNWTFVGPEPDESNWTGDVNEILGHLQASNYLLKRDPLIPEFFAQLAKTQAAKGLDQLGYGILSYPAS